jgi:hypothetical protein
MCFTFLRLAETREVTLHMKELHRNAPQINWLSWCNLNSTSSGASLGGCL